MQSSLKPLPVLVTLFLSLIAPTWLLPNLVTAVAQPSEIEQEQNPSASEPLLDVQGVLEPGDSTLTDDNSLYDEYSFVGKKGQTVTIVLESLEFDTYLLLFDSQREKIGENDDASEGNSNSVITITLPEDSTYRVLVNAYDAQGRGQYALRVVPVLPGQEQPTFSDATNRQVEASQLNRQGVQQFATSQFRAALQSFEQALAIYREIGDREGEGTTLNNLGRVYNSLGQYNEALKYYQQALAIVQEIGDREGEGTALSDLGYVYDDLGQYPEAIEYYQQALAIRREVRDRAGEGATLNNLGMVYHNLGQYEEAIEYYQQALVIVEEVSDRAGKGATLNNLGMVYHNLGRYEEAIEYYKQALAIKKEVGDRATAGKTLNNLGLVYNNLGQYEEAIEYYQQALTIFQDVGDRATEGYALNNLGLVYHNLEQYEEAIEYYQQALVIHRKVGNRLMEGTTLNNLGGVYFNQKQYTHAEKNLYAAIFALESLRPSELSDADKISIFETYAFTYRFLQQTLIAQNKTDRALEISERGRARALVELLAQRLSLQADTPTSIEPPSLDQIKQIAKAQNATLVEYSIIDENFPVDGKPLWRESELYIWIVKPTGEITFRKADLKPLWQQQNLSLTDLVTQSRQSMGVRGRNLELSFDPGIDQRERLRQLHQLLIAPIADLLPANPEERVIFIPQRELFLVPFPALQDAENNYLIEQHTILTAPAIQVLDLTREQRAEIAARRGGFSEPSREQNDTLSPKPALTNPNILIVGNPTMPSVTTRLGDEPQQLANLPGAEREATEIANLFNLPAITGSQATKSAIVSQLANADIIHFATHGLLDDTKGLGIPGAIALAPDGTGELNDGLLTAGEIFDLKLNAELVVLSACDTGRGDLTGDGVIGLSRSLISAGVPSVVVSLWAVPDAPTAELMVAFYQNWQETGDKAQALRQAMLEMKDKHPNPKDWAAFTLIGEAM